MRILVDVHKMFQITTPIEDDLQPSRKTFIFLNPEIHGDYKIPIINNENPASIQYFFKNIFNCLQW